MPPLQPDLRKQLENTVIAARDAAEAAASAALVTLAVERSEPFPSLSEDQRSLRRALRAVARQLGEGSLSDGMPLLVHEIAYEQWHRMLFARYLAENQLLMHPGLGIPVTLEDCADLAADEGAADAWDLAARYAGAMLPGLFLADDPTVRIRLAPEHRHALEKLVQGLPSAVFTADDSLGWVYQFWQNKKKAEVNASEEKIGAATLGPVTQLFTEDYMVKFLLHNSLGAWWAARHPASPLIASFDYLRWQDEAEGVARSDPRTPAAGTFAGWPQRVSQVTMMDPCGGSGHFVVAAFDMFVPMRIEEEGLSEVEAVRAVLRDNLHMLDIDPRCCQIAAFNLLFTAWKRIGYTPDLPVPHIA
ncbi:MAG: SAM-dependent DNA methyltransferase, partial [Chloroflexota bacterium]|nr:SAM-dependent DNA methyltransferase [Chloroflexota bacterium]